MNIVPNVKRCEKCMSLVERKYVVCPNCKNKNIWEIDYTINGLYRTIEKIQDRAY